MILSETQERFVKAIAAKVPLEQIAEIHFFQPIRQGGMESGVAVIATREGEAGDGRLDAGDGGTSAHPEPLSGHPEPLSGHPERSEGSTVTAPTEDQAAEDRTAEAQPIEPQATEGHAENLSAEQIADEVAASLDDAGSVHTDTGILIDAASPVAASESSETLQADPDLPVSVESGELPSPAARIPSPDLPSPPRERYVIYTARYRLTLKGPDRGKWETNVVAEADAPLLTVDAVVRGVQRRSGDVEDPIRLTGEELIALTRRTQHPAA